ncbi:tyrosine-type recombinase/integrase [Aliivibrio fischeri]|uniref:tyrosine-type recombinase/integrase n=1 Tax=Aliivibrio fischeri TaxID=668 RepID=UPI0012D88139|nr:site-specific integrase [Aliivibrio fischeri]MUJ20406.1 site-specific integrase [Aliivibrio fischeri]
MRCYPLIPGYNDLNVYIDDVSTHLKEANELVDDALVTYEYTMDFFAEIGQSRNNYKSFRTAINLFFNWCWFQKRISVTKVTRKEMRQFVDWCNEPPHDLISSNNCATYVTDNGDYKINPKWRPFLNTSGKPYSRTITTVKNQLSLISSWYVFLADMNFCVSNPAAILMRRLTSNNTKVSLNDTDREKSLNDNQFANVMKVAHMLAAKDPEKHERTLFLAYILFFLYPRISEISCRVGYSPTFSDFQRVTVNSSSEYWCFNIPSSKGGKSRKVSCNSYVIKALKRYRRHLGLSDLPSTDENIPLFIRHKPGTHGRQMGEIDANLGVDQLAGIITGLFKVTAVFMKDKHPLDAAELKTFTAHSARHYGISLQVRSNRPLADIAMDSGHGDLKMLQHYISKRIENRIILAFNQKLPFANKDLIIELAA